ncbi:MAG TPA: response regulator [Gemmataceae bacterium]|jgi:CheY-like chemotaxis protein|nr:response regulator [Gemmataceae bacterium]
MAAKRVLSVGQCFADHSAISRTLEKAFAAEVVAAEDAGEALARLSQETFDLVLVNRILDRDGSQGLELIKQITTDGNLNRVPVMLVSNYEDSQQQAVACGAVAGFGKAALGQPHMLGRVRQILQ